MVGQHAKDSGSGEVTPLPQGRHSGQEILHALGLSDRKSLRQQYLSPVLECGYVEMTRADTPNARTQRYRLTPGIG